MRADGAQKARDLMSISDHDNHNLLDGLSAAQIESYLRRAHALVGGLADFPGVPSEDVLACQALAFRAKELGRTAVASSYEEYLARIRRAHLPFIICI